MQNIIKSTYRFITSLRCAIVLLIVLAISSIIGTVIPQGMPDEAVIATYGRDSLKAWFITHLHLNDLYHSPWFQFLLTVLAVNIILCTVEHFPKTMKLWTHEHRDLSPERLKKFSLSREFKSDFGFKQTVETIRKVLGNRFGNIKEFNKPIDGQWGCIAHKGRFSLFMVYGIHLSIILILLGAFVGSVLGFRGMMTIVEGDSDNLVRLARKNKAIKLPFTVRCDDFRVEFYENGMPKEYISFITVLKGKMEVQKARIKVNEPFTYEGVTFYQASYGSLINEVTLVLTDPEAGKSWTVTVKPDKPAFLESQGITVHVLDFREDFSGFGPAVAVAIMEPNKKPEGSWILIKFPKFHGNRIGKYRVAVEDYKTIYYTGLQVKRDPGVWIVWIGFGAFIVFLFATFYWSYRNVWVSVVHDNDGIRVFMAGRSSRNSFAFEREFDKVCAEIMRAFSMMEAEGR